MNVNKDIDRRGFLTATGVALAAMACAPSAAPAPAAPAAAPAPAAAKAAWEGEWEKLVEAAKKEGKLAVFTLSGAGYRSALGEFEKMFGITVEHQAENSSSVWVPKMQKEREAGLYSFDILVVPPNSALIRLKPSGAFDPIRPLIFRPDVLDDKVWPDGFDNQFMDAGKSLAFGHSMEINHNVAIDTNQVQPDEIKSIQDLLNPKWKGKMVIADARSGATWLSMQVVRSRVPNPDDYIKRLLVDQQPMFIRDDRQRAETVVRSRNPIVLGIVYATMKEFNDAGVANHVKFLDLPDMDYAVSYTALLYNKAPHPNAAKLFINWFLTKEGQTIWSKAIPLNSARADVEIVNNLASGARGTKYHFISRESEYAKQEDTQKFLNKMLGIE
ncbi:MAG: ABC transporter substrate-binding protein [Dehalococcoidia bacterium]|nr:ABC transporter substrate-binding protein [Dehalococcoidia bacterium]